MKRLITNIVRLMRQNCLAPSLPTATVAGVMLFGVALAAVPVRAQDMTAHGRYLTLDEMSAGTSTKYHWEKMYFANLYTNNNIQQYNTWTDANGIVQSPGWQHIKVKGSPSSWTMTASWDWTAGDTHNASNPSYNWSVKSYPSILLGWHWNVWDKTGNNDLYYPGNIPPGTGLSLRLWNIASLSTRGHYEVNRSYPSPSTMDVAFDMWIHNGSPLANDQTGLGLSDNPKPGWGDSPITEIMVWNTALSGARPAGSVIAQNILLGGNKWALYRGWITSTANSEGKAGKGAYCYSFVPQTLLDNNFNNAPIGGDFAYDLRLFVNYLLYDVTINNKKGAEIFTRNTNGAVIDRRLSANDYLTSVELGSETFNGQGQFILSGYSCTPVRYQQNQ